MHGVTMKFSAAAVCIAGLHPQSARNFASQTSGWILQTLRCYRSHVPAAAT